MKNTLLLYLLAIFTFVKGQDSGHLVSISYSNNGQIRDVISEFYFDQGAYLPNNDVFTYKERNPKYNFHYEYVTKNNLSISLKGGYSSRKDEFKISSVRPAHGSKEQSYTDMALGVKYVFNGEKVQFSTGLEIPYFIIGTFTEKFFMDTVTQTLHQTQVIDGGKAFGINSVSSAKFFLTKTFFFFTDLRFGFLSFDLGKEWRYTIDYQNPVVSPTTLFINEDTFNKTTMTDIEIYFGIGLKL